MEPVTVFLNAIKLARKQSYKNLAVFPLLAPDGDKPDYLTLEQALERGFVKITEMDQAGSVPELRLISGIECFGCSDTFGRFFGKLVKSYALDALDHIRHQEDVSVPPEKVRRFIQSIHKSKQESHPSIGLGETVALESRSVSGEALVEEDRVLHFSAFKKDHGHGPDRVPYRRFSQRRGQRVY